MSHASRDLVAAPSVRYGRAAAITLILAVLGAVVMVPSPARADGPTTFSNTTSIDIPAVGSPSQTGPASPYPSSITVAGMAGVVTAVQVVFSGLTHSTLGDVDALVVAPSGESVVVLSDIGDPATLAFANDATLTFDDAAAGSVPNGGVPTGTYRPTNGGAVDAFPAPAPAPAPSAQTTLAGAFSGIDPNGAWQLFIVDDAAGDLGAMARGWSLIVTTEILAAPPNGSQPADAALPPTGTDAVGNALLAGILLLVGVTMVMVPRRRWTSRRD
ncbi:hypothetical protein BH10ACT7_BH10ACT7_29460 [soil metagenome]